MALCTNLNPINIFFGGFNGGYGKMWIYNLRSEFFKHKITIIDTKIEHWNSKIQEQEQTRHEPNSRTKKKRNPNQEYLEH